jgi:hypothetical protein
VGEENCRSLGGPGFPVKVGGVANSMRFSLQKTAHAALSSAANRKSGYARDDNFVWALGMLVSKQNCRLDRSAA